MTLALVTTTEPTRPDRITIPSVARLRFDELRCNVSRIASTMLAGSATTVSADEADKLLGEIAAQANAARLALRRGK